MNKKIKQYSALAIAAAAVLPMACKKDKNDNNSSIDDPNITVRSLNLTITDNDPHKRQSSSLHTSAEYSFIDFDNNGIIDMYAYQYYFRNGDTLSTTTIFAGTDSIQGSDLTTYFAKSSLIPILSYDSYGMPNNDTIPALFPMTTSEIMNNSVSSLYYGYLNYYSKIGSNIITRTGQFQGQGDKYIGIKFKIGTEFHFGWMKVNLSNDGKSLIIREVAYDTRPNTPITVGAR